MPGRADKNDKPKAQGATAKPVTRRGGSRSSKSGHSSDSGYSESPDEINLQLQELEETIGNPDKAKMDNQVLVKLLQSVNALHRKIDAVTEEVLDKEQGLVKRMDDVTKDLYEGEDAINTRLEKIEVYLKQEKL